MGHPRRPAPPPPPQPSATWAAAEPGRTANVLAPCERDQCPGRTRGQSPASVYTPLLPLSTWGEQGHKGWRAGRGWGAGVSWTPAASHPCLQPSTWPGPCQTPQGRSGGHIRPPYSDGEAKVPAEPSPMVSLKRPCGGAVGSFALSCHLSFSQHGWPRARGGRECPLMFALPWGAWKPPFTPFFHLLPNNVPTA